MSKINIEKQDSVKLYKIRKILEELGQKSGRGTELISVYIPKGKQLHEIIGTLQQEQGTADNIKSDLTRSHVVDSLGKVIQSRVAFIRFSYFPSRFMKINNGCPKLHSF